MGSFELIDVYTADLSLRGPWEQFLLNFLKLDLNLEFSDLCEQAHRSMFHGQNYQQGPSCLLGTSGASLSLLVDHGGGSEAGNACSGSDPRQFLHGADLGATGLIQRGLISASRAESEDRHLGCRTNRTLSTLTLLNVSNPCGFDQVAHIETKENQLASQGSQFLSLCVPGHYLANECILVLPQPFASFFPPLAYKKSFFFLIKSLDIF